MNWFQPKTQFIEKPAVEVALIQKCLATDFDGLPVFDAYLTVIESHRKTWHEGSASAVSDHGKLAQFNGAEVALEELVRKLRQLRAAGQKDD